MRFPHNAALFTHQSHLRRDHGQLQAGLMGHGPMKVGLLVQSQSDIVTQLIEFTTTMAGATVKPAVMSCAVPTASEAQTRPSASRCASSNGCADARSLVQGQQQRGVVFLNKKVPHLIVCTVRVGTEWRQRQERQTTNGFNCASDVGCVRGARDDILLREVHDLVLPRLFASAPHTDHLKVQQGQKGSHCEATSEVGVFSLVRGPWWLL